MTDRGLCILATALGCGNGMYLQPLSQQVGFWRVSSGGDIMLGDLTERQEGSTVQVQDRRSFEICYKTAAKMSRQRYSESVTSLGFMPGHACAPLQL